MGLIDGALDVSLWTEAMTAKGLESNLWLLAYEADLKGWLTPQTAGFVQNHPYFAELRRRKVAFYDEERGLTNVQRSKPKMPSEAFKRHMAALRNWKTEGSGAQVLLEEWEHPDGKYREY